MGEVPPKEEHFDDVPFQSGLPNLPQDISDDGFVRRTPLRLTLIPHLEAVHRIFFKIGQHHEGDLQWLDYVASSYRYRPNNARLWREFPQIQERTWDKLDNCPSLVDRCVFPGENTIKDRAKELRLAYPFWDPDLSYCLTMSLNYSLTQAMELLYEDETLKREFSIEGYLQFDSLCAGSVSMHSRSFAKPIYAVLRMPKHCLNLKELVAGLNAMHMPDVLKLSQYSYTERGTCFVANALFQLFTLMVDLGVWFGYIYTSTAFVFCRIPKEDPKSIEYYLCVPTKDVRIDRRDPKIKWTRRTALGQVLAFTLATLGTAPPSHRWHDMVATELQLRRFDFFTNIPLVNRYLRFNPPPDFEYFDSVWSKRWRTSLNSDIPQTTSSDTSSQITSPPQVSRPYCTVRCLLGTFSLGFLDRNCPNAAEHGTENHSLLPHQIVLGLLEQLTRNRYEGFEQLNIRGRSAYMIKATLLSHGYTVMIKATTQSSSAYTQTEYANYESMSPQMGLMIPVCLGMFRPNVSYWYHGSEIANMLILSWCGERVWNDSSNELRKAMPINIHSALQALSKYGAVYKENGWNKVLWNRVSWSFFIVGLGAIEWMPNNAQEIQPMDWQPTTEKVSPEPPDGPGMRAIKANKRKAQSLPPVRPKKKSKS